MTPLILKTGGLSCFNIVFLGFPLFNKFTLALFPFVSSILQMLFAHPRKTNVAISGSEYSLKSTVTLWSWTHHLTSCFFNRKKAFQ